MHLVLSWVSSIVKGRSSIDRLGERWLGVSEHQMFVLLHYCITELLHYRIIALLNYCITERGKIESN